MRIIINFLASAFLVVLASKYILTDSITLVNWFTSAIIFSIILAFINATIWTFLRVLGLPLNILTLGLFWFIITLIMIWLTDYLYNGIEIKWIFAHLFIAFLPALTWVVVWLFIWKK